MRPGKLYDRVAAIAAFNDNGDLLFGLRGDGRGWCLPGGHFEEGEDPVTAARRELQEETGLIPIDLEYLGSALGTNPGIVVWAFKTLVAGEPDASADPDGEFVEFRWVRPDDIPLEIRSHLRDQPNVVLDLLGAPYPGLKTTFQKSLAPASFDSHQDALVGRIQDALSDDLRREPWKGSPNCLAGHCYAASEALWHLLGGPESGYGPQQVHHEGSSHWYLRHGQSGHVIDPTADQFRDPVPYSQGKGKGFLTAQPSHRARIIIERAMNPLMKAEAPQHWRSQDGLRIPVQGTPERRTWNQKFVQGIAQAFAGGQHTRLKPASVDVSQPGLGTNMAVNRARLRLYRRMLSAGEKLPPVVVQRQGQGWRLLDGNHRLEAARALGHKTLPALEVLPGV